MHLIKFLDTEMDRVENTIYHPEIKKQLFNIVA